MIDLNKMEQYRENNRIEAKRATGGLPHSLWETYAAFANTLGGIILLGVEEYKDKSLHVVDLPDAEELVEDFWEQINDPQVTNVNILTDQNVQICTVEDKRMILISVPRAQRLDRPVYIGGSMTTGTYRRSGEGDYRCSLDEIQSMLRDSSIQTQDMKVLENLTMSAFNADTLHRYRAHMWACHPIHAWEHLEDDAFLYQLGAVGKSLDGKYHPTGAGLLMFGNAADIIQEFPDYLLDYREELQKAGQLTDRLISSSGDWSGNLYDFYMQVYERIVRDIKVPLDLTGKEADNTPVHRALREALYNSIINADYYGHRGLVIVKRCDRITISNPGAFRIGIEAAKNGGVCDPRNAILLRMFHLVNIGRRTGSGIPAIYAIWAEQGWALPVIEETFHPERITLSLTVEKQSCRLPSLRTVALQPVGHKEAIEAYLTDHVTASAAELAALTGLSPVNIRILLQKLVAENTIVLQEQNGRTLYKLRS